MGARLDRLLDRIAALGGRRRLALAALGLAGLIGGPLLVGPLFQRPDAGDAGRASLAALGVRSPKGADIGTLHVDYPRTLRENEDGTIRIDYRAPPGWRERFAAAAAPRLEVTVDSARLTVTPEPGRYVFDNARIAATGSDGRRWLVTPQAEGDHGLLVRLAVEPAGFTSHRLAANGAALAEDDEVSLPLTVRTRYLVSQLAVDLAKGAVALVSFLLTLPAAVIALRQLRSRGAAPAPAPAPPPAPAPAAKARPRKRR